MEDREGYWDLVKEEQQDTKLKEECRKIKHKETKDKKKQKHTKFQYSVKELAAISKVFKHNIEKTNPISLEEARPFLARLPRKRGR